MNNDIKELYIGCECMDLDHIAHLSFFPLTEEKKEDGEKDEIFFTLKFKSYFDRILPPIRDFYQKWEWNNYFYHNWFNKVIIGLKSLASMDFISIKGIFDCFEFQNKDLSKLDVFLSQITNKIDTKADGDSITFLDNDKWLIYFTISKLYSREDYDYDFAPYVIGWEPQFIPSLLLRRIKYAFKYIFGRYNEEQEFFITKREATKLRGMIKWVEEENKKIKEGIENEEAN